MTDVIYCIPIAFCVLCFRLEKFSLLLPHSRCIHCTFLAFLQLAFRFGVCRYLVYQFVLFLITGVLSHCYTFSLCSSFPGMRSSFIRLFPHGRCYSLHFYYFYIQEILPGTIALASFSLCFCVPASSLLFCHYYRFFPSLYYTLIANFALVFPA